VLAIDRDPLSIWFARRHFSHPAISFRKANCELLALPTQSLDLVFGSNVLEHLEHPETFLATASNALLARFPWSVTLYHHRFVGSGPLPDFTSPFPSRRSVSDFSLLEGTVEEAYRTCPYTAVFVARRMAAFHEGPTGK
jgi:hypothetical protein